MGLVWARHRRAWTATAVAAALAIWFGFMTPATASGHTLSEKTANLDIANRVAGRLRSAGITPAMTRTGDSTVSLGSRTAAVSARRADLFVSIHNNCCSNSNHSEVYEQVGDPSSAQLAELVAGGLRARMGGREVRVIARASSTGVDRDYYYVLRNSPVPAIIVEGAFVSNPTEARLLATSSAFRQSIADGVADGIVAYERGVGAGAPNLAAGIHLPLPIVPTPSGVRAAAMNSRTVNVSWTATAATPTFRVYRDDRLIGEVANAGPGRRAYSFVDHWVGPGQRHTYDVRAAEPAVALVAESLPATATVRIPGMTVVVDPGHGGVDSGALGSY